MRVMWLQHPPVPRVPVHAESDVHDTVAEGGENVGLEGLREKVRHVVDGADVQHGDAVRLNECSSVEILSGDVFRLIVVLRVVRDITGGLVVDAYRYGADTREAELGKQIGEPDCVRGRSGGSHYLGLARREGDGRLLGAGPGDSARPAVEDVAGGCPSRGPVRVRDAAQRRGVVVVGEPQIGKALEVL